VVDQLIQRIVLDSNAPVIHRPSSFAKKFTAAVDAADFKKRNLKNPARVLFFKVKLLRAWPSSVRMASHCYPRSIYQPDILCSPIDE
jgi:hypothetical protein